MRAPSSGLCRFLLRDPTEAEDATQQAFLSAYRSLLGGAVPREPAAWLAAIARNECWGRIKRRMREPLTLHDVSSDIPDTLDLAAQHADLAALREGLASLSRPQREAFLLREFSGLSYGELATALGITEPAVDSLLFRARTRLRRALSATHGVLVPVALRDQLAQLIPGFDQPAAGALVKLVSLPIAAKLAAVGAGAVLIVAGSSGLGRHAPETRRAALSDPVRPLSMPGRAAPSSGGQAAAARSMLAGSAVVFRAPLAAPGRAARTRTSDSSSPARASRSFPKRDGEDASSGSIAEPAGSDTGPTPDDPPADGGDPGGPTVAGGTSATDAGPTDGPPTDDGPGSDGDAGLLSLPSDGPSADQSESGPSLDSGSSGSGSSDSSGTDGSAEPDTLSDGSGSGSGTGGGS